MQLELSGIIQLIETNAVGNGRRILAAENQRADCEVHLIHHSGAEQGIIEASTAFTEHTLHAVMFAQEFKGGLEIHVVGAADINGIGGLLQFLQPAGKNPFAGQHDDRGAGGAKDGVLRIHLPTAADDDPHRRGFLLRRGTQRDVGLGVERAGTGEDSIRLGA